MTTSIEEGGLDFDYRDLRLMVGAIAFSFPWLVVLIIAFKVPPSISASYHTVARDVFVGLLFVIGALLFAYRGHNLQEEWISTIGGLAAIVTALFPTYCDKNHFPTVCNAEVVPTICTGCGADFNSTIHYSAAVILFSTVVYFCLFAFTRRVISKIDNRSKLTVSLVTKYALKGADKNIFQAGKRLLRLRIYLVCGLLIAGIMLSTVLVSSMLKTFTFWAEAFALGLFGIAWMTASKFWFFGYEEEKKQSKRGN